MSQPGPVTILGIDPGLEHTGYGVIQVQGNAYKFVACGRITTSAALPVPRRLSLMAQGLADVIDTHAPTEAAVEETFVNTNAQSSLKLGQARGVALLVPCQKGLQVFEYAARLVKKSLVGTGKAEKNQVAHMVKVLLPMANLTSPDAADALAIALTHANHRALMRLVG